jgi:hypothetical protein
LIFQAETIGIVELAIFLAARGRVVTGAGGAVGEPEAAVSGSGGVEVGLEVFVVVEADLARLALEAALEGFEVGVEVLDEIVFFGEGVIAHHAHDGLPGFDVARLGGTLTGEDFGG